MTSVLFLKYILIPLLSMKKDLVVNIGISFAWVPSTQ
jgi:hypothetical protein